MVKARWRLVEAISQMRRREAKPNGEVDGKVSSNAMMWRQMVGWSYCGGVEQGGKVNPKIEGDEALLKHTLSNTPRSRHASLSVLESPGLASDTSGDLRPPLLIFRRGSSRSLLQLAFTRGAPRVESKVILVVGMAIGVAFLSGARLDPTNLEANERSNHRPPPLPPPRMDKGKGVLGGPPQADPTPLHLQARPSRPLPTWNNESNGGNNGQYGGYYGNNGGPNSHQGGHNSYQGGQQSTSPDLEVCEPYGPQASQYGCRFGGTQWENVTHGHRWEDRNERDQPRREPIRECYGVHINQVRIPQVHIDFPRFNGNEPLDWIFQVEEYFTCQFIQEEEWLQTSVLHFDGEARRWYRWLKHNELVNDWEEFKDALLLRFGESTYVDYDIELRNLKQTSSVQEYQARFENLASMVEWTPKFLIAAFIGGLKEEIQIDIRAEKNEILRKYFARARAIEDRQRKKQALYRPWRSVQTVHPREVPQQRLLPAPPKKEEPKPVYKARAPPPMTREECKLMIKNKKCFWVYTVLEQVADEEEKEQPLIIEEVYESEVKEEPKKEEEAPPESECSMMADANRPQSMKILGKIGDHQVLVLLDSRATHNFIGDHIASQLSCTMEEQPTIRVLVANGDILSCTHKCTEDELTLQKVPFKVELLVVPIPCVDVILGVKWLKTLGRVWWDFSTMEMCLPKEGGGEEVVLRAIDPSLEPRAALRAPVTQKSAAWLKAIETLPQAPVVDSSGNDLEEEVLLSLSCSTRETIVTGEGSLPHEEEATCAREGRSERGRKGMTEGEAKGEEGERR
ncbi:hypothetical protein EJ110_NYTH18959 [Nymphaea thermarum]|nr:hypothetical protein EJ110_NYTH18959 [Nymphaea thermarum]